MTSVALTHRPAERHPLTSRCPLHLRRVCGVCTPRAEAALRGAGREMFRSSSRSAGWSKAASNVSRTASPTASMLRRSNRLTS